LFGLLEIDNVFRETGKRRRKLGIEESRLAREDFLEILLELVLYLIAIQDELGYLGISLQLRF